MSVLLEATPIEGIELEETPACKLPARSTPVPLTLSSPDTPRLIPSGYFFVLIPYMHEIFLLKISPAGLSI